MVKVSIVMPVYNCEEYLQESLDSVLRQTLQEWELLCVDDGSSDDSLNVLRRYAQREGRIRVYTQRNQGAGVARNLGLQHACGEYIAFLDADDYFFDKNALKKMYDACAANKTDSCGSVVKLLRNGVIAEDAGFKEISLAAAERHVLDYCDFQFDYGYYGFIFKASVLKEHGIVFPPYRRFQDPPFFVKAMVQIGRFCFADTSLYCYRTPNVAVRFNAEKTMDLIKGLQENLEFAKRNSLELLFERTLQRLEVEYCNVICNSIGVESVGILQHLLEINSMVRSVRNKEDYIIQPLRKIMGCVSEVGKYRREQIFTKMYSCERMYIYGAGNATTDFLTYLQKQDLFGKVKAIIVTSKEGNPDEIKGIPVIAVDNFNYTDGDLVVITVTSIYRQEIVQKLEELGVTTYEFGDGII